MNTKEAIAFAKEREARVVDFRFTDMPGTWHHFSIPIEEFDDSLFEDGLGFDGSSIRGFQAINESDMLLLPDPSTAFMDPFTEVPTLVLTCDIEDPMTRTRYSRDPRYVAFKAERYLQDSGIADIANFGPEAEFYIFDDVRYGQNPQSGFYYLDSEEGIWNSGREEKPNLGYKVRHKEGYYPCPPVDKYQDLRTEMMLTLIEAGVPVEVQHHEVGTAGQAEIDYKFGPMLETADRMMKFKYIIKNVAYQNGYTATFMPKPIYGDNGSGMHCHISLWKKDKNLMFDEKGYAGLSELAVFFIGGILKHAASLLAFSAPTTNSYRRLVPGYEAPINLIYSQRNRSACVRIPMYSKSPKSKRIEFRAPDPAANPYLAFSAMLMAGLDGIQNKIVPPDPMDKDLYELPAAEKRKIKQTPGNLEESLAALNADKEYLLRGGVFTEDLIDTYIEYKSLKEADQIHLRPHPYEFFLYYDC